jgi:RHS repeat-associated protein
VSTSGDQPRSPRFFPVSRYVWDVASALPALLDDGERRYVWGAAGLAYNVRGSGGGEQVEVYHPDHLGSTRALSVGDGSLSTIYLTDEYGVPTTRLGTDGTPATASTQPIWFAGELQDWDAGTNLVYLRARHYDPGAGRFTSRDPWAGTKWQPGSLNRYAYAGSNPTSYADPGGLWPKSPDEFQTCLDRGNLTETLHCIGLWPFGPPGAPAWLLPYPFEDPSGAGGLADDVARMTGRRASSGADAMAGGARSIPSPTALAEDVSKVTGGVLEHIDAGYVVRVPYLSLDKTG